MSAMFSAHALTTATTCAYLGQLWVTTTIYTWSPDQENYNSLQYTLYRNKNTDRHTHTHLRHYSRLIDFFAVDPSIQTAFFFQVCDVDIYSRKESLSREISDHLQFVSATTAQVLVPINYLIYKHFSCDIMRLLGDMPIKQGSCSCWGCNKTRAKLKFVISPIEGCSMLILNGAPESAIQFGI